MALATRFLEKDGPPEGARGGEKNFGTGREKGRGFPEKKAVRLFIALGLLARAGAKGLFPKKGGGRKKPNPFLAGKPGGFFKREKKKKAQSFF